MTELYKKNGAVFIPAGITFEGMFNKVFDNIENNNFDKAKNELDVLNHYTKYWL